MKATDEQARGHYHRVRVPGVGALSRIGRIPSDFRRKTVCIAQTEPDHRIAEDWQVGSVESCLSA